MSGLTGYLTQDGTDLSSNLRRCKFANIHDNQFDIRNHHLFKLHNDEFRDFYDKRTNKRDANWIINYTFFKSVIRLHFATLFSKVL